MKTPDVEDKPPICFPHAWPKFLLILTPVLLILGGIISSFYFNRVTTEKKILADRERAQVTLQKDIAFDIFNHIAGDLVVMSQLHEMISSIEVQAEESRKWLIDDLKAFSKQRGSYDQIRFIDETGMEYIRVNHENGEPVAVEESALQDKSRRYYFTDTIKLSENQIYVSPMDLNIEKGKIEIPLKPMLRFGTPLYNASGELRGAILLNYRASHMLDQIERIALSDISQFSILNHDGYWMRGPDSTLEWGFMFEEGKSNSMGQLYPEEWQKMLLSEQGQFTTSEGLFTYCTIYPLSHSMASSTGAVNAFDKSQKPIGQDRYCFYLVSQVPADELAAMRENVLFKYGFLFFVVGIFSTAASAGLSCALHKKRMAERARIQTIKNLQEALDQIKTLEGILPVCSKCKDIRNEEGSWDHMENYIQNHSSANFSHGLCPKCIRDVYPDLTEEEIAEIYSADS